MPTIRQKKAFIRVLNGSTISKSMVKAGYSETTASTTGKLTNTKGWKELMDKYLPDDKLAKVHNDGLKAMKKEEGEKVEDYQTRHRYLDTAYKLKGSYAPEKRAVTVGLEDNFNKKEVNDYEEWREQRVLDGAEQESSD